jgi:hypothetical protein
MWLQGRSARRILVESVVGLIFAKGGAMQMVKIQIPERSQRARALVEMSGQGRVICLPDNVFVVPEQALQLLQSLGVHYQELGRGRFDYAEKALLS